MDRSHTNLCFCTRYEKSPEETLVTVLAYQVLLFACRHFNSFSFYRVLPGEARCPSLLSQEVEKLGWTKRERKWQAQGFDLSNQPRGPSSPLPVVSSCLFCSETDLAHCIVLYRAVLATGTWVTVAFAIEAAATEIFMEHLLAVKSQVSWEALCMLFVI